MAQLAYLALTCSSDSRRIAGDIEIPDFLCRWGRPRSGGRRRASWGANGLSVVAGKLATKIPARNRLRTLYGHLSLIGNLVSPQRLGTGKRNRISIYIAFSSLPTSLSLRLIRSSIIETRDVHGPSIAPCILGESIRMGLELMSFQVHLRLKNHKLLVEAFLIQAEKMFLLEVMLEGIVVDVVLLLATPRSSITDKTTLVAVTTVGIQLVVPIKALMAKSAFRMPFKTTLIDRSRDVIAIPLMFSQFRIGKKGMLMRKHFFVPDAKITAHRTF